MSLCALMHFRPPFLFLFGLSESTFHLNFKGLKVYPLILTLAFPNPFLIFKNKMRKQCYKVDTRDSNFKNHFFICSVQFSRSVVSDSKTPWTAAHQASLSITNSQSLLKLMSITSVMPSNHLILCHPLLLLPSIFPSIRVFSNESLLCIRWPKYWSFSSSSSPSKEYSGPISFRIDWLDLLAVQWLNSHIHT